jgi:hypothetical protein
MREKPAIFPAGPGTAPTIARFEACTGAMVLRDDVMNDASQLATAMVAVTFTAMLLITGQWFVDYRMQRLALEPATVIANLPK